MAVKEIKADVGDVRVLVSGHETSVFLYIVDGAMVESRVLVAVLSRDQASDIAFALLGDRAAPSPFTSDTIIEPEPEYVRDSFYMPPVEEEDEGYTYSDYESDLDYAQYTDLYDDTDEDLYANDEPEQSRLIAATFAAGQEIGDTEGFERGYASAVDDFRHGLWADEGISYAHRSYLDEQTTPEPSDYHSYSDIARDGRFE